jgi:hypothetical protein
LFPSLSLSLFTKTNSNKKNKQKKTIQKKRVPVTIRYSAESGMKPYYLTVAKRVKDLYPDVIIDSVEVQSLDGSKSKTDYDSNDDKKGENSLNKNNGSSDVGSLETFEVIVDGKIVVRTGRANQQNNFGSVFVSMTEMDIAITRARKRRRPSTVYGENGVVKFNDDDDDESNKLEVLKNKAIELQLLNYSNKNKKNKKSNKSEE